LFRSIAGIDWLFGRSELHKSRRLNGVACGVVAAFNVGMDGMERPRLLDQVRQAIRMRHYSPRTEEAYVGWIRRFILFHKKRHPVEMGEVETNAFFSEMASVKHVSASTQTQALCALMFLYKDVLGQKTE